MPPHVISQRCLPRPGLRGYTLIEVMLAVGLLAVLAGLALPAWNGYQQKLKQRQAMSDITQMQVVIQAWFEDTRSYPADLATVGLGQQRDPWGALYQYNSLAGNGNGQARKDHSLVPINSDFDLYSMGPDGESVAPLTAAKSKDDIIRASNGRFVGIASDY